MKTIDLINRYDQGERNFAGANLIGADLSGANLREADLSGANLIGAYLRGADLSGADLGGVNLREADLSGADLRGAYLRGADLWMADLRGAHLWMADLRGANLRGADLSKADLGRAALSEADFSKADLRGVNIGGADLSEVNLVGAKGLASKEVEMQILKFIKDEIISKSLLDMSYWHTNWEWGDSLCGTTHCAAGSAQVWASLNGLDEYEHMKPCIAGSMLIPSVAHLFYASNNKFVAYLNGILAGDIPLLDR